MPVVSPFVLTINGSSWDLTKVVRWEEPSPQTAPPTVIAHFLDTPNTAVSFNKVVFEAAMQAALDAAI
jgi:hypothetical protein